MDGFTPKQLDFVTKYFNPESETFNNAKKSAIAAGYSEEYADVLIARDLKWMSDYVSHSENINRQGKIVEKAEKNLDTFMDSNDERVKADMTKFALSRLKKEVYSERSEHTGKGGKPIAVKQANINADDASEEEVDKFLLGELS